jgi:hypothetical protein
MEQNPISNDLPPIEGRYNEAYQRRMPQRRRFVKKAKDLKRIRSSSSCPDRQRKPSQHLQEVDVIKLHCPHKDCGCPVFLVCPHCNNGALRVDKNQYVLYCEHCHQMVKDVRCPDGHMIRPSYIKQKQKRLEHLTRQTDKHPFFATLIGFVSFGICIELIIYVLGKLGGYH